MEFQGTIMREGGTPFGTFASMQAELTYMFPGLVFEWTPSGIQKLADIDARRIELPEIVRRSLMTQPSFLCGSRADGDSSVSFNIGSREPVDCVWTTIGGNEVVAGAALAQLRRKNGWRVEASV